MEDKLQESFSHRGFSYTQLERQNDSSIFLVENDVPIESRYYFYFYEVIKIKKQKARSSVIQGKEVYYPAKEIYPGDKDWGILGWTFKGISEAMAYFLNLTKKVPCSSQSTVKTEDLTLNLTT